MSMSKSQRRGRPSKPANQKIVTTSIGIHPIALARIDAEAKRVRVSRSHLIVEALREKFPSVFADL